MAKTRDFAEVIRKKLASDPDLAAAVENEAFNANVAQEIYDARTAARLTQKQLADKIGTQQSVIARLEDADYEGHSLTMLKRIAQALGRRLRVGLYSDYSVSGTAATIQVTPEWSTDAQWDLKYTETLLSR